MDLTFRDFLEALLRMMDVKPSQTNIDELAGISRHTLYSYTQDNKVVTERMRNAVIKLVERKVAHNDKLKEEITEYLDAIVRCGTNEDFSVLLGKAIDATSISSNCAKTSNKLTSRVCPEICVNNE